MLFSLNSLFLSLYFYWFLFLLAIFERFIIWFLLFFLSWTLLSFIEFCVKSINDIIKKFLCFLLIHFTVLNLRKLQIKRVKLFAFMISFLGNVEFKKFSFDRFLLIDSIDVLIEIFKWSHIFVFDFGLNYDIKFTGAWFIWSGWICLKNSASLDLILKEDEYFLDEDPLESSVLKWWRGTVVISCLVMTLLWRRNENVIFLIIIECGDNKVLLW